MARQPRDLGPFVWSHRIPVNYPKQIEVAGGIAAPLLAGFSLTSVALLVTGTNNPPLAGWAVIFFSASAVLLISAVQFSAKALGYAATPGDRLDFVPEAATRPEVLRLVRERQWEEMELRARYSRRAELCYDGGMLGFLAGLGLLLVPVERWPFGGLRIAAVVVVSLVLLFELVWTGSHGRRPRSILPQSAVVAPDEIGDEGASLLYPDRAPDPEPLPVGTAGRPARDRDNQVLVGLVLGLNVAVAGVVLEHVLAKRRRG